MKTVNGRPITGSRTAMNTSKSVKTSPDTSADAERLVKQPPMPFQNKMNIKNLPISERKESYDSDYTGPNKALIGTKVGAKALPSGGPVGQKKPINQSGQVFGRMGTKHPSKVGGADLKSKFPGKRNAGFFGE